MISLLVQQAEMSALTRRFLCHLLEPEWFQGDAADGSCAAFLPREFKPMADEVIIAELAGRPTSHREYVARLMLDF